MKTSLIHHRGYFWSAAGLIIPSIGCYLSGLHDLFLIGYVGSLFCLLAGCIKVAGCNNIAEPKDQ